MRVPLPFSISQMNRLLLSLLLVASTSLLAAEKKLVDAKNIKLNKAQPDADPELEKYAIFEKTAPFPTPATPISTDLPLKLKKGTRIALIGNTLFDRSREFGWFESRIHQLNPGKNLVIRSLAWSADEIDIQPRPDNFGSLDQHLTVQKPDVIFAAFGFNESFGGPEKIEAFRQRLTKFVQHVKSRSYNGKSAPKLVLFSPIANENIEGVKAADLNNANIAAYSKVMKEVAAAEKAGFIDAYTGTESAMKSTGSDLTLNGCHLNDEGYQIFANVTAPQLFGKMELPPHSPALSEAVVEKNTQFYHRYRPLNTFYYTGGRNKSYGYLDFLPAMRNFDIMVANRDKRIWDIAAGKSVLAKIDDSNVPPLPETIQSRGANEWLSPADELKAFDVDPRFEVNIFASEETFPDIACPIQIRWDSQGRLWVACSTTYPHIYPGQKPHDKIVILEDTDQDGVADKSTVFADDVHIPLSFELGDGGVYVSEEPHLTFLKDTDGDGKADLRKQLYTGFGVEDSHHALHDFVWTPEGDLLFRESIFHNSQVETPYGPIRAKNSAWFQLRPESHRLTSFGNYPNTNPWGVTFDDWGQHVASHPIFASAFHATNPPYPEQHPRPAGIPAYSGTCGQEFIDFPNWPKEMQGNFIKVRYKPNNRVEIHKWNETADSFEEEYVSDLIFSRNLSFIPVDIRFGPRGGLYICDWYNPIKGHAQYSLRDVRRDRKSGRIFRIVPKGNKQPEAPKIAGASDKQLLDILKRPEYRIRYIAKRELRERNPITLARTLDKWVSALDADDPRFRHHQLEALWLYRALNASRPELLKELMNCEVHYARAAATRQFRHQSDLLSDKDALLKARANDESGLVRLEAAIAASYIGGQAAFDAVVDTIAYPAEAHLKYAIATALGSETLRSYWRNTDGSSSHPEVAKFMAEFKKSSQTKAKRGNRTANEAAFDSQKGLKKVKISCVPERMLYTVTEFTVKAGQPVRLIFENPDATPHNLVIIEPGSEAEIGMAGNAMAATKDGLKKHFIPTSKKILHHTKLINVDQSETMRFKAPKKPGNYPYICTFPGHWIIMKGVMKVVE